MDDGKKICKCGKVLSKRYNITRHIKSTKHRKYLEENKAEIDKTIQKYEQYEHLADVVNWRIILANIMTELSECTTESDKNIVYDRLADIVDWRTILSDNESDKIII